MIGSAHGNKSVKQIGSIVIVSVLARVSACPSRARYYISYDISSTEWVSVVSSTSVD